MSRWKDYVECGYTYTLGFDHAVNEGTGETSQDFLCLLMALGLAVAITVLLVRFGSL